MSITLIWNFFFGSSTLFGAWLLCAMGHLKHKKALLTHSARLIKIAAVNLISEGTEFGP